MLDDPEEGLKQGFQDGRLRHARLGSIRTCICLLESCSNLILLPLLLLLPALGLVFALVCTPLAPHTLLVALLVHAMMLWNEVASAIAQMASCAKGNGRVLSKCNDADSSAHSTLITQAERWLGFPLCCVIKLI